jgi:catechol 2,3-dioxygenase-like lactoylglutathione lyase family enzyme
MLGRFLEVSIQAASVLESLEFYQKLGFTQAEVGEAWPHPYAVVTDGRLFIGLHQHDIDSPALTFVKPDLVHHLEKLEALGIEFDSCRLGEDVFNQATFRDPDGVLVTLIEARTFSPPSRGVAETSWCGYFAELGIPTRDADRAKEFWELLGFVAVADNDEPFRRVSLTSDHLDLGLYATRELRRPVLTFSDGEMAARVERIARLGIEPSRRMPAVFDPHTTTLLVAPEGTGLLLMTEESAFPSTAGAILQTDE